MSIIEQNVSFPSGAAQLGGMIARPEGAGPFPAVVVIHEAFGLNDNIRTIARRLADQGYLAFAVDLFAGRNRAVCMFRFVSGVLANSLDHGGIHDLRAALDFLVTQPAVDTARIGTIGFCMGGSFAVAWACTDDRLQVIAPFYSFNPQPIDAVARACPVVGSFPQNDPTRNQARTLDAALTRHAIPHDIKTYPGARHSFFNDQGRNYDPAASDDAWQRTLAFFAVHIGQ